MGNHKAKMTFGYDDLNSLSYALQLASMDCYGIERMNGADEDYNPEMGKTLNTLLNKIQETLGFERFDFAPKDTGDEYDEEEEK